MIFLAPALLFGIGAVAAPIVLHLIMRRQPQLVVFPPLQFLKAKAESNRRNFRLRHLLLLLLRALLLAIVALAMARPLIPSVGFFAGGQAPVTAVMVFDTSARMDAFKPNLGKRETRLDAAKQRAMTVLAALPEGSHVWVFESRKGQAVLAMDPAVAGKRVERLTSTQDALPLQDVISTALQRTQEQKNARRELYVFTDFNAKDWQAGDYAWAKDLGSDDNSALIIVDVGLDGPINLALSDLTLSSQNPSRQDELRLAASLSTAAPAENVIVELVTFDSQGGEQLRGQTVTSPTPAAAASLKLPPLTGLPEGITQGLVRIVGDDDLAIDNERYFTVYVRPPAKVLLAGNEPLDESTWLLAEAITPTELRAASKSPFESTVVPMSGLDPTLLADQNVLVLHDPGDLADSAWNAIHNFAAAGGGVAINLGASADVRALNRAAPQRVLPGKLERVWRAGEPNWYLAPDDYSHPLLSEFPQLSSDPPWASFPIHKFWQLSAEDWQTRGVSVIASNSIGRPVILEQPIGLGKLIVLTTPLGDPLRGEDSWNDLLNFTGEPAWPGFVLTQRLVDYLSGSSSDRWNYLVGDLAQIKLPVDSGDSALLSLPSGESLQQTLNTSRGIATIASTGAVGSYRLRSGGQASGWERGFSINLRAEATDLRKANIEQVTQSFGKLPHRIVTGNLDWDRKGGAARGDLDLFEPLAFCALFLFLLEFVFSNRFYAAESSRGESVRQSRSAA